MGAIRRALGLEPLDKQIRAPKGGTLNLSYVSPGAPMVMEWSAEDAFRWGYLSNIVVYRCVQLIAETIAALPFRAGRSMSDPTNFNEGAPLARLLGPPPYGPNPEIAADELWANAVAQYLVAGRFGWEIEYSGKTPVGLWPLAAQRLKPIPTTNGRASEYFAGFLYGPPGDETKLDTSEVFYCWRPSLHDFRQPESALQAARLDISVAVMQDRYDNAFLKNDARPAAVMTIQRFAEDSEFRAFKDQVNAEYGGADNAGKMMIHEVETEDGKVNDALFVQTLGLSQKDAEFIKRHELKFRNIAIALGVPWSKLDASGRTYDNADVEDATWEESCIIPIARHLQNRVNMKLAPLLGTEVGWFDLSSLKSSRPIKRFASVPLTDAVGIVCSTNEAREDVGLEPVEGGDDFDPSLKPEPPVLPAAANTPDPAQLPPAQDPPADRARRHPHEPVDHDIRRAKLWKSVDRQTRLLEKHWARTFRGLFERQERETIKRLEGKRGRQMIGQQRATGDEIYDLEYWRNQTREEAAVLYQQVAELGAIRVSDKFDISFDLESPHVQEFIASRANKLAGQVSETTYESIKATIGEGVAQGEDIPTLAERVREVFSSASKERATTIARTEVISAFNGSTSLVASQLPSDVAAGQEWIATMDSRTRGDHADANGQRVPIGQPFSVAGFAMAYPGDPNGGADQIVNCRCTIGLLTAEEMADMEGEPRSIPVEIFMKRLAAVALGSRAA